MKIFFKIFLLYLLPSSFSEVPSPRIFFQGKGKVYAASSLINVELNINMNEYSTICALMINKTNEVIPVILKQEKYYHTKMWVARGQREALIFKITKMCEIPVMINRIITEATRHKRDIAEVAAEALDRVARGVGSAIVGAVFVFSTILGLFNLAKVEQNKHIDNLKTAANKDFLLLEYHDTKINALVQATNFLEKHTSVYERAATKFWQEADIMFSLQRIESIVDTIGTSIGEFTEGLTHLFNQKISINLLKPNALIRLWKQLLRKAANRGHLIFDNALDLLQLPVTHFAQASGNLRIYLHVPVAAVTLQLYNYRPFPITLQNTSDPVAAIITHKLNKEYLAINVDNSLHIELSASQLQSNCWRFASDFVCEDINTFTKNSHATCLAALYMGDPTSVQSLCDVRISDEKWAAERVDQDRYLMYAKNPMNYYKKCHNGSSQSLDIHGYDMVLLSEECRLISNQFMIFPKQISSYFHNINYQLPWNTTALLAPHHDANTISALKRNLTDNNITPEDNVHDLFNQGKLLTYDSYKLMEEDKKAHKVVRDSTHFGITLTTIVFVILAVLMMGACAFMLRKQITKVQVIPLNNISKT